MAEGRNDTRDRIVVLPLWPSAPQVQKVKETAPQDQNEKETAPQGSDTGVWRLGGWERELTPPIIVSQSDTYSHI